MTQADHTNHNNSDAIAYAVEVYLFYPKLRKTEIKGDFKNFFSRLDNLDEQFSNCTLFLNQASALQYSRFISSPHAILKAYVADVAIAGDDHGLTLKKGFLQPQNIHGCYPSWAKGVLYITNPAFVDDSLPEQLQAAA